MAKYEHGILGPFRGKLGTVIGVTIRGQHVMKGLGPIRIDKPTDAQKVVRSKLSVMSDFLNPLKDILTIGFVKKKNSITSFNQAMRINLEAGVIDETSAFTIDYAKIILSSGSLHGVFRADFAFGGPDQVKFEWDRYPGSNPNDNVRLVLYSPQLHKHYIIRKSICRSALQYVAEVPQIFGSTELYGWMLFSNGKDVSNTIYLGSISIG
ncbi:MAG: hypothetical protein EOO20_22400 [Chryseobacterium sp.]|nr:MAG: hypothetical protein EOO20_22400 [Chryseobacterium sp.]